MVDNTALKYTDLKERLDENAGLKLTEAEFLAAFPEVDFNWDNRPTCEDHPFIIQARQIFGCFRGEGLAFSVLRLVSFEKAGEPLDQSWV